MKKKELILVAAILAAALALWAGMALLRGEEGGSIRITVDGEEYGTWPLSKDEVIEIGDTNVCEIKDGEATMIEADCPDHLCMYQGAVGESGGMIICLPNRVIIEAVRADDDEAEIDGVAQ